MNPDNGEKAYSLKRHRKKSVIYHLKSQGNPADTNGQDVSVHGNA
jgi:hypothetical protein